ncbi:MAG TPA: hypothetical protein VEZ40_03870, partial [Pyrinomonadaceae bacterium]|nr:hypothetical protein [Pyrinomonadaceae bacterium]
HQSRKRRKDFSLIKHIVSPLCSNSPRKSGTNLSNYTHGSQESAPAENRSPGAPVFNFPANLSRIILAKLRCAWTRAGWPEGKG